MMRKERLPADHTDVPARPVATSASTSASAWIGTCAALNVLPAGSNTARRCAL